MFSLKDSGIILTLHFDLDSDSTFDPGQQKLRSPSRDASGRRICIEAGFCLCTLLILGHLKDKLQKHPQ